MIRAFIAIDLPDAIRGALAVTQQELQRRPLAARVSWARIANLHLTLQFLGETPEEQLAGLSTALGQVAAGCSAFRVPVEGVGAFPDTDRPRVIWAGCADPQGKLAGLAAAVQAAMAGCGYPSESRPFVAHLTLGRIRRPRRDRALTGALDSLKNTPFGTWSIGAIHLYRSQLHPDGSIYTKLASHTLKET